MEESLPLESPSMSRRQLLNFLTGAAVAATAGAVLYPVGKYFGVGNFRYETVNNTVRSSQLLALSF